MTNTLGILSETRHEKPKNTFFNVFIKNCKIELRAKSTTICFNTEHVRVLQNYYNNELVVDEYPNYYLLRRKPHETTKKR